MQDIPNYLGNPINAFTIIKRLTTDLDNIEDSIKIGTGKNFFIFLIKQHAPITLYSLSQNCWITMNKTITVQQSWELKEVLTLIKLKYQNTRRKAKCE